MAELTPMMKQYMEIKENYKDTILFYRLGDFYEMFFDDAKIASKELEITLTGRDCGQEERAPMCGIPFHSADSYIAKLISKGYKVAICEQTESPDQSKGIVKREVIRVITPGTVTDVNMLEEAKNNYLASVYMDENGIGVCFVDVSTGEMSACEFLDVSHKEALLNELSKFSPSEVILNKAAFDDETIKNHIKTKLNSLAELYFDWCYEKDIAIEKFKKQFNSDNIDIFGITENNHFVIRAIGAILVFLYETQKVSLVHITNISFYSKGHFMELDISTRRNLELTETMREKEKKGSLIWVLDKTKTAMGARLLRKWVEQPLINCTIIKKRQNAVNELFKNIIVRSDIIEGLKNVFDIERLLTKIVYEKANGRDLKALSQSICYLPEIYHSILKLSGAYFDEIKNNFDVLSDIAKLIDFAIVDEPPFSIREGNIIKEGYSEQVDEYKRAMNDGKSWIAQIEQEEKEKTGIKNLKIGFNKVFGYYIEITNSQKNNVPEHYIRKQTLANCERFITQKLKDIESVILGAEERITKLEYELFCEVRASISKEVLRIKNTANQISVIDVLCSFAEVAAKNNYTMPDVNFSDKIIIKDGRHPVVEKMIENSMFVPNDAFLDTKENQIAVITGPNMAGKSTYMRQTALIVLMSQIGSFVPASSASIGITDKIFTRVGASDDLASGQSTFMVEMSEVANILKNATNKSLLILDEIGRGTSTYDGLSIAWAVIEYIANAKKIGARTLFATHYHELTELENSLFGVKNFCIAVKKRGDDITFLRKIVSGGAEGSYGIEVAKLAGVPNEVIARSKEIHKTLEENDINKAKRVEVVSSKKINNNELQMGMEIFANNDIIKALQSIDVTTLTPIEALNKLYELQNKLKIS